MNTEPIHNEEVRPLERQFTSDAYTGALRDLGNVMLTVENETTRQQLMAMIQELHILIRVPLQEYMGRNPDTDRRFIRPQDQYMGSNSLG